MNDRPPLLVRIFIIRLLDGKTEREYTRVNWFQVNSKIVPGKPLTWFQSMALWALNNGMGLQIRNERDGEPG